MRAVLFGVLFVSTPVFAAPNVLNNSIHAADAIRSAVSILASGVLDGAIVVDVTSLDNTFDSSLVTDAANTTRVNYSSANNAPTNHAPYTVVTSSFGGFGTASNEPGNYGDIIAEGLIDNWAYVPTTPLPISTPPPIAVTNISRSFQPLETGGGVEYAMTSGYKGFDTSSPSGTTASFAGLLAVMKYNHPTWLWGDVKAALRQTATNWATGYDHTAFGYGNVDYDAATAVASPAALYLQPPGVALSAVGNMLSITLYPFRQTRRAFEAVYIIPLAYAWPVKNEYVAADIVASGAVLLYTSSGADVIPRGSVLMTQPAGDYYVIAFTTDGAGAYSRVEPFSSNPVTVYTNGVPCL